MGVNSFEFMCLGSFKFCNQPLKPLQWKVERPFSIEKFISTFTHKLWHKIHNFQLPNSQATIRWPCKYFIYNNNTCVYIGTYTLHTYKMVKWNRHWKTNSFSAWCSDAKLFPFLFHLCCWCLGICAGTCSYRPGSLLSIHHRNISDIKDEKWAIQFYLRST